MTGRLQTSSISAPGFLGLNSQESEVTLESGYATQALNCVIDRYGRLGSRRGWLNVTTNRDTLPSTSYITSLFEFKGLNGTITYLSSGNSKLFTGLDILTEKKVRNSANTADIALSTSNDNWQWASLGRGTVTAMGTEAFAGQNGNPLIMYYDTGSGFLFKQAGDVGAVPTGLTVSSFDPNCVLAAFGRLWCGSLSNDRQTLYYSKLLDGSDFAGAGSGVLDISSVVGNADEIVAISAHNNFLVIFCKQNIVIYSNASDPTNITLADVINGVGCIARDSVQQTGTDLIFLSKSGIRSLQRTIQEKSMPMRELSLNVRDDLVNDLNNETASLIKSIYFERDAFYLLSLPSTGQCYCFDTRQQLPNGASRVTIWNNFNFKAFCTTEDRNLLLGSIGGIAKYFGYTDNGLPYRMVYFTSNTDVAAPSILKFLKKARLVLIGNQTQDFVIKYGFDYSINFTPRYFFNASAQIPSEYNVAEYGIGEYTGGLVIVEAAVNLGGSGRIVKFGIETEIDGAPVSVQKADIYLKIGKVF